MRKTIFGLFLIGLFAFSTNAQTSTLEGYIFEGGNQGYLNSVTVRIIETTTDQLIANTFTNQYGFFTARLPIGKTYALRAEKDLFNPEEIIVKVESSDEHQKIYTKIKMFRTANNTLTERGSLVQPPLIAIAKSYGIDSKQINPVANPDGVTFSDVVSFNDPYAEVTNATRLVDENYDNTSDREALKYEEIPTAYNSNIKIKLANSTTEQAPNRDIPDAYKTNQRKKIVTIPTPPKFGETIVASAANLARTGTIPADYVGYKIEFITALAELPASHEIFKRHGNIIMERRSNGIYSYLLGDFTKQEEGQKFLEETMINRYPSASLIAYENGQRILKKERKKKKFKPLPAPPR